MGNIEDVKPVEKDHRSQEKAFNARHASFRPGGDSNKTQGDRHQSGDQTERGLRTQERGDRHQGFRLGEASDKKGDSSEQRNANASGDRIKEYRQVEIVDQRGKSLGEFDRIQNNVIIEDKSAKDLDIKHPRTGQPVQSADQWAEKHIYKKTDVRIQNIDQAAATRPTKDGTSEVPSLDEVKQIHEIQFRVESKKPDVERATNKQLDRLRSRYPDWKFSATFGS